MPGQEPSDRELVDRYRNGDAQAFEALYERYRKQLYSYLNKMMPGQTATVDDVFQDTWIKAVDKFDRYEHRQTFLAWLICIGRNKAIDHFRRTKRRPTEALADQPVTDNTAVPWREIGTRELTDAIEQAIKELPAEQEEVFRLRQNKVPFKEIAEIQQCSQNTALGRMHYAVRRLRKILAEWR